MKDDMKYFNRNQAIELKKRKNPIGIPKVGSYVLIEDFPKGNSKKIKVKGVVVGEYEHFIRVRVGIGKYTYYTCFGKMDLKFQIFKYKYI